MSAISLSVKAPVLYKYVIAKAKEVSSPLIPNAARLYSTSLSLAWCGAWSVTIASSVPSFKPSIIATLSRSSRIGGLTLVLVSKSVMRSSVAAK